MEIRYTDIAVHVKLDEKAFKRFAYFDAFAVRKKWIRPAVCSLILILSALAALFFRKEQYGTVAAVLLAAGVGLFLAWAGVFLVRVNTQASRANLKPARDVYNVTLLDEGVRVQGSEEQAEPQETSWGSVQKAFRKKGCIYLYITDSQVCLLPSKQADAPDHEVWAFIREHLGEEKCKG